VPSAAVAPLCLITEEEMIPCDATFAIDCGRDGGLHHDIDGLWWRADG
jgi:hypothetical protein